MIVRCIACPPGRACRYCEALSQPAGAQQPLFDTRSAERACPACGGETKNMSGGAAAECDRCVTAGHQALSFSF